MAETNLSNIFIQQLNGRLKQIDEYMEFISCEQQMTQNMISQALVYCRLWLTQEDLKPTE